MKKSHKKLLSWILLLAIVLVLLALWIQGDDKQDNTKASLVAPGLATTSLAFDKSLGNTSDGSAASTLSADPAQGSQQLKNEVIPSKKDVCDELAEERKTAEDWKQFEADLHKNLDSTLPDLAKALEKVSQTENLVEKASALYLLGELKAALAINAYTPDRAQCEANDICSRAMWDLEGRARMASVNEIAKMAVYSSDAKLYMIAFNACRGLDEQSGGYCSQINARQWASRDPNNGMAWMYVLSQLPKVESGKNNSAVDEVLFRITQAKYFDGGYSILSNLNANSEMQLIDSLMRSRLEQLASDAWKYTPLPSYMQVSNSCKGDFLQNQNRRQICNQIVEKWQRDDALAIEFAMTIKLGENLGWDATRIANLRDEWYVIRSMLTLDGRDEKAMRQHPEKFAYKSCKAFLKSNQEFLKMMSEGELKQYRKRLATHNRSRAELLAFALAEQAKAKAAAK